MLNSGKGMNAVADSRQPIRFDHFCIIGQSRVSWQRDQKRLRMKMGVLERSLRGSEQTCRANLGGIG
jgi:hypothetical protein